MTVERETRSSTGTSVVRADGGRWAAGAPSPNPKGRPSVPVDVKVAAKAHTHEMLEVLVDVAVNPKSPPSARVAAANAILDRAHGKPTQGIEASVGRIDFAQIHLEALKQMTRQVPTAEHLSELGEQEF